MILERKELSHGYVVQALDSLKNIIKGEGGTVELAFCWVIEKLKYTCGHLVTNNHRVFFLDHFLPITSAHPHNQVFDYLIWRLIVHR